jgi:hypothetical protein
MKKIMSFLGAVAILFAFNTTSYAAASTFTMSAIIPTISSVIVSASSVTGTTWADVGSALNFGQLTLNTFTDGSQAYLPASYFAIDVAGYPSGMPTTTQVSYTEGSTGATKLGARANVSFMAVTYNAATPTKPTETAMTAHVKKPLANLATTAETITKTDITNLNAGWLRIYVGLNDGKTAGYVPFNPADAAGTYTGTLTITTTL